ncbi:hypothetical protein ACFLZH_04955, partial [Patescibacteria group bacterium]
FRIFSLLVQLFLQILIQEAAKAKAIKRLQARARYRARLRRKKKSAVKKKPAAKSKEPKARD